MYYSDHYDGWSTTVPDPNKLRLLALDCLAFAEGTCSREAQEAFFRLAERCVELGNREERPLAAEMLAPRADKR